MKTAAFPNNIKQIESTLTVTQFFVGFLSVFMAVYIIVDLNAFFNIRMSEADAVYWRSMLIVTGFLMCLISLAHIANILVINKIGSSFIKITMFLELIVRLIMSSLWLGMLLFIIKFSSLSNQLENLIPLCFLIVLASVSLGFCKVKIHK
jgi:hypothetical protein